MSFGDDIRTIARTRELQEKIDKAVKAAVAAQKAAIEGKRAIAYMQSGGSVGTQGGGSPGETKLDEDKKDDKEEEKLEDENEDAEEEEEDKEKPDDEYKTDPSKNGSPGGDRTQANPGAGSYNISDLINGATEGAASRLAPSEPGDKYAKQVNKLWGVDPVTGQTFMLNTHGFYDAVEGWQDPTTPPQYGDWEQGFYWMNAGAGYTNPPVTTMNPVIGGAPGQVLAVIQGLVAAYDSSLYSVNDSDLSLQASGPNQFTIVGQVQLKWKPPNEINNEGNPDGSWIDYVAGTNTITKHSCILSPHAGAAAACALTAPPEEQQFWPLVGNYALALIGNLWTPSKFDSEVPPIKKTVSSSVVSDLGDGDFAVLRPAKGGGHIMYKVDQNDVNGNPVDTGNEVGLLFRNDWTLERFVPPAQVHRWTVPGV